GLALLPDLHRDGALNARRLAALAPGFVTEVVEDDAHGQGEVPEWTFRAQVQQADQPFAGGALLADPFDAEVGLVLPVGEPDDLIYVDLRLHTGELGAAVADVHRRHSFGKDPALLIRAKNPHRKLNSLARLAALTHRSPLNGYRRNNQG